MSEERTQPRFIQELNGLAGRKIKCATMLGCNERIGITFQDGDVCIFCVIVSCEDVDIQIGDSTSDHELLQMEAISQEEYDKRTAIIAKADERIVTQNRQFKEEAERKEYVRLKAIYEEEK